MSKFGIDKGKRAEREVVRMLQPIVDRVYAGRDVPRMVRNSLQSRMGGADIGEKGFEWIAIEVKHVEQFHLSAWWEQAKRQATDGRVPVLIYKRNNVAWRVRMFGTLEAGGARITAPVDIAVDVFMLWFEHRCRYHMQQQLST